MPDSHGKDVGLTNSDSYAGKEGLCKHKIYVETSSFIIIRGKDNSVQVSFISGCHKITPVLSKSVIS